MTDTNPEKENYALNFAESYLQEYKDILFCKELQCFRMYETGVYGDVSTRKVENIIQKRFIIARKLSLKTLKEVIYRLASLTETSLNEFNSREGINFKNGFYDIKKMELIWHSSYILSTSQVDYNYDKDAGCPLWENFLLDITEGDKNKVRTIQEFFGYCLTRNVRQQKSLIFTGQGANGKSVIFDVIRKLVGNNNCSTLALKHFNNSQKCSVLDGKLVNICEEVSKKAEDFESEFRSIVDGAPMTVSPKHVQDYEIYPYAKIILSVNNFPYIDDKTNAFYRRLLIVNLPKNYEEENQNKNLPNHLKEEIAGIFNWALAGLVQLNTRGYFLIDEYMKKEIEEIKFDNNPILHWIRENIMVLPKSYILKSELYDNYKAWCDDNSYHPLGINKVSKEILKIFKDKTEKNYQLSEGSKPRVWPNLVLRNANNEKLLKDQLEGREPMQGEIKWDE